ncbi:MULTISPECIES: cytochrome c-type biogenesis CcmF C-terminal domain-containing protein [unclassified Pseudodesulfovibrio]|uniref:heme lyase CcmF/NrfE family subunit n=1 Tax=unclassified Pseudodesulfovibrio TaxID=2661612 RepID=UPI000FEBBD3F|nr:MULTISPECIES: cytochrome c-type biogenesis CcmF C-terminal domain-containing protein [unclassified Pseudodesulfovibrio]MCJ2162943.1 cytochrome c biogenesis protein CcsA [Pseudodesulfovibrio sp. S3-i]RWU06943.1 heme lyase CcmF/NrfE family subunit [Pseudodesulfovibrio sp. S3]
MHLTGYVGLLFSLLAFLFLAGFAGFAAWSRRSDALKIVERGQLVAAGGVIFSTILLLAGLTSRDYSFRYVYDNVDNALSFVYTLTALWGGREGSLLFWELIIAVSGMVFVATPGYKSLSDNTKLYFWMFFLAVQGFFMLLLTGWSNPFIEIIPAPVNGRGLNPLLRNPGMIFHPPLLFLGFGLYAIPACAALAASIAGEKKSWITVVRNWNILSWVFLTAGIVLGGWWSYMELGWGGYWAWDPVENASLIPWFSGTAVLHTAIIESRRNALQRSNVFLMSLTFILCIFSTYLTRSGVIQSLHSFGESGVAQPLFWFMIVGLLVTLMVVFLSERLTQRSLSDFLSRQGMLVIAAWFLLALGLVVTLGTMWPVISQIWTDSPMGLDANFYNRVCLPFMSFLVLIFCYCPWLGWKGGIRNRKGFTAVSVVLVSSFAGFYFAGMTNVLAALTAAASVAAISGIVLLFVLYPHMRNKRQSWGAYGVHLGLVLLALGIAFSGPYKAEQEVVLAKGEFTVIGDFTLTFASLDEDRNVDDILARATATLEVVESGKSVGTVRPDKRIYKNFPNQQFAEVATIPSLGDELYVTLLGLTEDGKASFKISVNPLVNWIWIGGSLMCLIAFLLLRRVPRPGEVG